MDTRLERRTVIPCFALCDETPLSTFPLTAISETLSRKMPWPSTEFRMTLATTDTATCDFPRGPLKTKIEAPFTAFTPSMVFPTTVVVAPKVPAIAVSTAILCGVILTTLFAITDRSADAEHEAHWDLTESPVPVDRLQR